MISRRAFIGGLGVLGLSLAGCGTGNVVTDTTASPDATTVEGTPSEKPAQPRVTESCVTTAMGYSFWTAIIETINAKISEAPVSTAKQNAMGASHAARLAVPKSDAGIK